MISPRDKALVELEYIRTKYGKPAYVGVKVRAPKLSPKETGTITGGDAGFIVTYFEKQPNVRLFNANDLEYLGVEAV